jgi:hypothetical protein
MTGPRTLDWEAILDRWAKGQTSVEIAFALNIAPEAVRTVVQRARKRGDPRADRRCKPAPFSKMNREAKRRGMTRRELERLILRFVARDNLFAAVLDDNF